MAYVVLLIVIAALVIGVFVCVVTRYRFWVANHYNCPGCKEDFRPVSFVSTVFAISARGYMHVECPKCGHKDFMKGILD